MLNKINFLRFLIVVLFLSTIAIAAETTWRHSGFEISGYDINGSSTYNLTEIRKIEFGWNSTIPAVSETSRAVMYYDDNQKRIMQSLNGGAYQAIVDNATVDFQTGNASNITRGVLPNASIPASAMNYSSVRSIAILYTRDMTAASGNVSYTGAGFKPTSIDIEALHNNSQDESSSTINSDNTFVSLHSYNGGTVGSGSSSGATVVYIQTAGSVAQQASLVSIDNDGITLNWGKTGLPTGTAYLKITYHR